MDNQKSSPTKPTSPFLKEVAIPVMAICVSIALGYLALPDKKITLNIIDDSNCICKNSELLITLDDTTDHSIEKGKVEYSFPFFDENEEIKIKLSSPQNCFVKDSIIKLTERKANIYLVKIEEATLPKKRMTFKLLDHANCISKHSKLSISSDGITNEYAIERGKTHYYFSSFEEGKEVKIKLLNAQNCFVKNSLSVLEEGEFLVELIKKSPPPPQPSVQVLITNSSSTKNSEDQNLFDHHPSPHVQCISKTPLSYISIQPNQRKSKSISLDTNNVEKDFDTDQYHYVSEKLRYKTAGVKKVIITYRLRGDKKKYTVTKQIILNRNS